MSGRKKAVPVKKPAPYSLYEHKVCAPDVCNINANNRNGASLAEWWKVASAYVEAMDDLGRVVMFAPDGEGGYWLASHPSEVPNERR